MFSKFNFINILLVILSLILICSTTLSAKDFKTIKDGVTELIITENTYQKLCLKNSIADFSFFKVETEKGFFIELTSPDYAASMIIGNPKLPVLKKMIEVPLGAIPKIKIVSYKINEYHLNDYGIFFPIVPSQSSVSKDTTIKKPPFKYNEDVYKANNFLVSDIVSIDVLGIMRGARLGRLNIAPIQYNPIANVIRVYEDIEVEIIFENADVNQTIALKEKTNSFYFNATYDKLLNYKLLSTKGNQTKYPVTYIIVSPPAFRATLQPFVQWKTKKGFKVIEAYTDNPAVGQTTTSIKNYLQSLYNAGTSTEPAPSFVLFVGDVEQIPTFNGKTGGNHPTDLYYCEYTNDMFPDIYYGRFSATTIAELIPQIDKTLEYEQYLMPDPSFLNHIVMVAGYDVMHGTTYCNSQINYGTTYYFNSAHNLTAHTYLYPVHDSCTKNIISDISKGCSFVNYTAHGSYSGWDNPRFCISDISTLANAHKYPLIVSNACKTNTFSENICFGEALLRAENKGAVGYIGASNSTFWDEDYWWAVGNKPVVANPAYSAQNLGAFDKTFHDHGEPFAEWFVTQGQMIEAGNLAVTQAGGSSNYYWEIYCLMGDPSLMIYYSIPSAITAMYDTIIPMGATTFTVRTQPYTYIGISMNGVLYGASLADSLGFAIVPLNTFATPGRAYIVATKQNKAPLIDSVMIIAPVGPYIIYSNHLIVDINGNNNGRAEFGEEITLNVSLHNVGAVDANGVNAVLSTADTYITITNANHSWNTIANGIISMQNNAFAFTVANNAPDQHVVHFIITITDSNGNSWNALFNVILYAPKFIVENSIIVNDPLPNGNNNGKLDAGETANIIIKSSNIGHVDAVGTIGVISSQSTDITLNSTTYNFDTMKQGTGGNAVFNVTVSPSATLGAVIPFNYTISSGSYNTPLNFNLSVGLIIEDWENGTFSHHLWNNDTIHPWTITTLNPYQGIDCVKSGTITDSESSILSIGINVIVADSISFFKKTSCEDSPSSWWDHLDFSVDGISKGKWDGETAWSKYAYYIPQGIHLLKWSYIKDFSISIGQDAAWLDYIVLPGLSTIIAVNEIPVDTNKLLICYPNPVSDNAIINYFINQKGSVSICLFNTLGQEVRKLVSKTHQSKGNYYIKFDASGLPNGIYYCVMNSSGNNVITQKIIIQK